jgi:hypothetical protein
MGHPSVKAGDYGLWRLTGAESALSTQDADLVIPIRRQLPFW